MSKLLEQIHIESKPHLVGDLADIKYGFGLPEPKRIPGDIPVYASSGIVGSHNEAKVSRPSIIVGRKGNVGSVYYSEQPSYPIDTAFFIDEPKKGFDLKYVFYLLQRINLPRYGGDSAVPGLSRETVYSIGVDTPEPKTQKKIAEILSAYDSKIENSNKIIKNLETTAQTLFKEWFMNFRFPGYEKVKMVESEMGRIPDGWVLKPLDEIAEFLNGVASQKYPPENIKISLPVIKIREMNSGIDRNSDRASKNIDPKYIVRYGDLLFSWSGSLELMFWIGEDGMLNQHIFKVTSDEYPKWFIYQWTKRHLQGFRAIADGKATTMGHIQRHHLSDSFVIVPDKKILGMADSFLTKALNQQLLLEQENINLKQSRDRLLAKLI